ncbi:multidrug effflux MFS transporter [Phenylobacterium immobile]|uniref:multidrug effflux MFS transporter n=1 Tax=Phenylobacterium immobile TaxID=21 RepID=UPI000AAA2C82|nr:multidrug effflux MFS transporter [Phenylobacterium immobile]
MNVVPKGRRTVGLVLLLGAMTAFAPMSIDMYLPSVPTLVHDLKAGPAAAQATLSVFLIGLAVGQLIYGPASDRWGRRPPVAIGVVIFVAASVLCAVAPTMNILLAGRFAQALGGCAAIVVARAVVADRFDADDSARIFSSLALVMGVAPIAAPLLGGLLLSVTGWRGIFVVLAAFGLVIGLATAIFLKESRSEVTRLQAVSESPLDAYRSLLGNRVFAGYALACALSVGSAFAYVSSAPNLLIERFGIPPERFGLFFGAIAFSVIASNQLNHILLRHFSSKQVLKYATGATIAAALWLVLATTFAGTLWAIYPPLLLTMAPLGLIQSNASALALALDHTRAGSASAVLGAASFAFGGASAAFIGAFGAGAMGEMAVTMLTCSIGSAAALYAFTRSPRLARPGGRSAADTAPEDILVEELQ